MYRLPTSIESQKRRHRGIAAVTAAAVGSGALLAACGGNEKSSDARICYSGAITAEHDSDTINDLVRTMLREGNYDPRKMDGVASTQLDASSALSNAHGAAGFVYPGDQITFCVTGSQVEFESAHPVK